MTFVHVLIPRGHYVGQTSYRGRKLWDTVTGKCRTPEAAMAKAVQKMGPDHKRARVLFIDTGGWYEPNLVMECSR